MQLAAGAAAADVSATARRGDLATVFITSYSPQALNSAIEHEAM